MCTCLSAVSSCRLLGLDIGSIPGWQHPALCDTFCSSVRTQSSPCGPCGQRRFSFSGAMTCCIGKVCQGPSAIWQMSGKLLWWSGSNLPYSGHVHTRARKAAASSWHVESMTFAHGQSGLQVTTAQYATSGAFQSIFSLSLQEFLSLWRIWQDSLGSTDPQSHWEQTLFLRTLPKSFWETTPTVLPCRGWCLSHDLPKPQKRSAPEIFSKSQKGVEFGQRVGGVFAGWARLGSFTGLGKGGLFRVWEGLEVAGRGNAFRPKGLGSESLTTTWRNAFEARLSFTLNIKTEGLYHLREVHQWCGEQKHISCFAFLPFCFWILCAASLSQVCSQCGQDGVSFSMWPRLQFYLPIGLWKPSFWRNQSSFMSLRVTWTLRHEVLRTIFRNVGFRESKAT